MIKLLKKYLAEGKVKKGSSDPAMAKSLSKQAVARLADLESLPLNEENASYRFEAAYECIREMVQSYMAKDGLKPYSHEAVIAFAKEKKLLEESELAIFDRYREIRNDITYRGEKTTVEESRKAIIFVKKIIYKLNKSI